MVEPQVRRWVNFVRPVIATSWVTFCFLCVRVCGCYVWVPSVPAVSLCAGECEPNSTSVRLMCVCGCVCKHTCVYVCVCTVSTLFTMMNIILLWWDLYRTLFLMKTKTVNQHFTFLKKQQWRLIHGVWKHGLMLHKYHNDPISQRSGSCGDTELKRPTGWVQNRVAVCPVRQGIRMHRRIVSFIH